MRETGNRSIAVERKSAGILSMLLFTKAKNKGFLTMSEEAQYYYGACNKVPVIVELG